MPRPAPDPGTPLQLLGNMVRIWRRYAGAQAAKLRALPPIIPLVIYHGATRWDVATSVLDCIAGDADLLAEQGAFRYHLRDLGPVPYEHRSASILSGITRPLRPCSCKPCPGPSHLRCAQMLWLQGPRRH